MVETAPTVIEKDTHKRLRAVARSATALFFALNLSACLGEVDDVRRLSDKYSQQETDDVVVNYLSCHEQPELEITPQGDSPFHAETVGMPDGQTATFLLPTLDRSTITKVRVDGQIEEYGPDNGSYELFNGELRFTINSDENRVLTSILLELDCNRP